MEKVNFVFNNEKLVDYFEESFDGDFFEGVPRNSQEIICNYVSTIYEDNIFNINLISKLRCCCFNSLLLVARNVYYNKRNRKFYFVYDTPCVLLVDVYEVKNGNVKEND